MWRLEKDPYLSSTVASLTVLDTVPDMERLAHRMLRATRIVPRLRQRVQPALGLQPPAWVDDADFDLTYHLRRLALAPPGDERDLFDLATLLTADPFDRTRPLWQMVIIEGLSRGRAALLMRFHHTLMDGEGGVRLSLQFLDFERDAPEKPLPAEVEPVAPPPPASAADVARDVVTSTMRVPLGLAREWTEMMANPQRIPETGAAAATQIRAIVKQLSDTKKALSPIWTARSLSRRLETLPRPPRGRAAGIEGAGRVDQHGVHHCRRRGCRSLPPSERRSDRGDAGVDGHQHPHEGHEGVQRVHVGADGRPHGRDRHQRALQAHPGGHRRRAGELGSGEPERTCERHCRAPDLAARADREAADRDDRLQHVERAGLTRAAVPRRGEGRRELPDRADGRHRVQPHVHVVRRKPRHGPQHRRRRGRAAGAAAEPHGGVVRRARARGSTARETKSATKKKPTKKVS